MTLNLRSTDDDMLEVCLEEDGFKACCFVSSTHLAYEKEKQLRDNIRKQSAAAYEQLPGQEALTHPVHDA